MNLLWDSELDKYIHSREDDKIIYRFPHFIELELREWDCLKEYFEDINITYSRGLPYYEVVAILK